MSRIISILAILLLSACGGVNNQRPDQTPSSGEVNTDNITAHNYYNIASNLYASGDYGGAYNLYRSSLVTNNNSDPELQLKAELGGTLSMLKMGNFETALEMLLELESRGELSSEIEQALVEVYLRLGKVDEAQQRLAKFDPSQKQGSKYYTLEGVLHDLNLEHELARQSYEKAHEFTNNSAPIFINLAFSYAFSNDFATSLKLMQSVGGDDELALIYALKGDLHAAEQTITRSLHQKGFGAEEVAINVAFYNKLATLGPKERVRAVLIGNAY